MTKIAGETKFNGTALLNTAVTITIQAGANSETRKIETTNLTSIANSISSISVANTSSAQTAITSIDKALENINIGRARMGVMQNRLEATSSTLTTSTENLTAAESRIRDVDVASEMMNLSKLNLLNQAAQAMMSQAKSQPEGVMQLLR